MKVYKFFNKEEDMQERKCCQCGEGLILCNGFVGGDLAALMRGEVPKIPIQETCNTCVLKYYFATELGVPKPFLLPSESHS